MWRTLALSNVTSLPFIGLLSQTIADIALKKDDVYAGAVKSPVLESVNGITTSWNKAMTSTTEEAKIKHTKKAMSETSALLLGNPKILSELVLNDLWNVYLDDKIEYDVKLKRFAGYSMYEIKQSESDRITNKQYKKLESEKEKNAKSKDKGQMKKELRDKIPLTDKK
jgi:hypothetical protein